MTATRQPVRLVPVHAMAAMHRAVRAVRNLHDEVVTGTEAAQRAVGLPWRASARRPAKAGADPARRS